MAKDITEEPDFAELLSAVLRHPDCPRNIYDHVTEALCEYPIDIELFEDAAALRIIIPTVRRRRRGRK